MMTLKEQEHSISFCVTRNFHVLAASKCVFFFSRRWGGQSHLCVELGWRRPLMQLHVFRNRFFVNSITSLHLHGFMCMTMFVQRHDIMRNRCWHSRIVFVCKFLWIHHSGRFRFQFWPHDKTAITAKLGIDFAVPFAFVSVVFSICERQRDMIHRQIQPT